MNLSSKEVQILASAINWRLHLLQRSDTATELSQEDRQLLRILLNELACQKRFLQFGTDFVEIISADSYLASDGRIQMPARYLLLIRNAINEFHDHLKDTPAEIEALTGKPSSALSLIISRMRPSP